MPAPQVGVGKLGAVGLVCQENSQSNGRGCKLPTAFLARVEKDRVRIVIRQKPRAEIA